MVAVAVLLLGVVCMVWDAIPYDDMICGDHYRYKYMPFPGVFVSSSLTRPDYKLKSGQDIGFVFFDSSFTCRSIPLASTMICSWDLRVAFQPGLTTSRNASELLASPVTCLRKERWSCFPRPRHRSRSTGQND